MSTRSKWTFVDLFCGCGGMSLGFKKAGFAPLLGVDVAKDATATYRKNISAPATDMGIEAFLCRMKKYRAGVLERSDPFYKIVQKLDDGVDVVVGCPPCQGYSLLGRMSRGNSRANHHESLNRLWKAYSELIGLLRPKVVVTENIPSFLDSPEFTAFRARFRELGYDYKEGLLDAAAFGVPQHRRRAIVIASSGDPSPSLPIPTGRATTVRDAIGELSRVPSGRDWHVGRNVTELSLTRYKLIPPGGNRFDLMKTRPDLTPPCWLNKPSGTTDVFGRLLWDRPALTIRTEFFKPEKGRYLHPEADRPITPREAAALQSFPASFDFVGSYTSVSRQIGEAVPPLMARAIAEHVAEILSARTPDKPAGNNSDFIAGGAILPDVPPQSVFSAHALT